MYNIQSANFSLYWFNTCHNACIMNDIEMCLLCCMKFKGCRCKMFMAICLSFSDVPMSHYILTESISPTDTTMTETWSAKCRASASSTNLFVTWELWLATALLSSTAWWRSASRRNWHGYSCTASGNPSTRSPWQRLQDSQSPLLRWPLHWRRTAEWEGLCEMMWRREGQSMGRDFGQDKCIYEWVYVCFMSVSVCVYINI